MNDNERVNARCPQCGKDFYTDLAFGDVTCPSCGQSVSAVQAKKYYESVGESLEIAKEAHGEDYHRVRFLIDECYGFLQKGDYENAEARANEALALTEADYRAYMAMVAVKTKNYTDLKDETHKVYLDKAIAVADKEERADVRAAYKNYYEKRHFSDEEMEKYVEETRKDVKLKVEKSLKNSIPTYLSMEKTLVVLTILTPIFFAAGIGLAVFALTGEHVALSLIAFALIICGYLTLRIRLGNGESVKAFNATLDLYDVLDGIETSDDKAIPVYNAFGALAEKFSERAPVASMNDAFGELINKIIDVDSDDLNEFMLKNKFFGKMVTEEE